MIPEHLQNMYKQEEIDEIINICDNLFYNNYYETGVQNTREEIQTRIKNELKGSFTDFFGKNKTEYINQRVDETDIRFVYQTSGPKNSIESFIREKRIEHFKEVYGANFYAPHAFEILNTAIINNGGYLPFSYFDSKIFNDECCIQLGYNPEDIINNENIRNNFISDVQKYAQAWKTIEYSPNKQVNEDMKKLEMFVRIVKDDKFARLRQENPNFRSEDLLENDCYGVDNDPIALITGGKNEVLFKEGNTEAYYINNSVTLGVNPRDEVIIHEFIHSLDKSGFEKGHMVRGHLDVYRKNEMFNEVITDYFAIMIDNARKKQGKSKMVNSKEFVSVYSQLFPHLEGFIKAYLPELKETRLRDYPAEEFYRVVGEKEFHKIAELCNDYIVLTDARNELEIERIKNSNKQPTTEEEYLKKQEKNAELSESIWDIRTQLRVTELDMESFVGDALSHQTNLRQKLNTIMKNGKTLSENLKNSDKKHLQKLAEVVSGASAIIEKITQKHVSKALEKPLEEADIKGGILNERMS